jgi:RNA polymerase sigma factor (sigma-70 family)
MTSSQDRDKHAFEALYDRTAERLLISLARRTQDPEVARDLWAECWAVAFEGWRACRAQGSNGEEAWLFGIARRRVANYWRSGAVERRAVERLCWIVPTTSPAEDEHLIRAAELEELRDTLADALTALPDRRRRAVALRIVDGLPYPEVAVRLGCSEDAARAQVSRGLRALQRHIESTSPTHRQGA